MAVLPRFAKATHGTPPDCQSSLPGWELGIASQVLDGAPVLWLVGTCRPAILRQGARQDRQLAYKASLPAWELGIASQVLDGARCQIRIADTAPQVILPRITFYELFLAGDGDRLSKLRMNGCLRCWSPADRACASRQNYPNSLVIHHLQRR